MTIKEMKEKKQELGYSYKKLSEISGVPVGTIQKIFGGETVSPRYDTVRALSEALSGRPKLESNPQETAYRNSYYQNAAGIAGMVCEADPGYRVRKPARVLGVPGDKTIEDYLALPEGARAELIDGKLYQLAAPTTLHQSIAVKIWRVLDDFVLENGGNCMPFIAPTDVQLDRDNKTMVQPDVFVVCDRSKISMERIVGAPDFVVEIISPGSAVTDMLIKLRKYKEAGVKEYWVVFPEGKQVVVYDFTGDEAPEIYTFDDSVPVRIWEEKCQVDFREITRQLEIFYTSRKN